MSTTEPMDELVSSIVERELGETAVVVRQVDEGMIKSTYEVRYEALDYILQLSEPDAGRESAMEMGLNCYRVLQGTGIPVPCVVTESVRELDGRKYVLLEKLSGESGKLDISPERAKNAARYLAKIHNVRRFETAGWLQFDDEGLSVKEFREGSLSQWRHQQVQDNARFLQEGGLEKIGRTVERVIDREKLESLEKSQAVLCHDDYSPDNVLFQNGEVTGIIDFDRAYAGDRHRDVVKAANAFWMHDPSTDWDVRETFYDGYQDGTELGTSFKADEPLTRVETLTVAIGGMLKTGKLSEYETDFYSKRIREAVNRTSHV